MVSKQKQLNKTRPTHSDQNHPSQWESTLMEVCAQFLINTQTLQKESNRHDDNGSIAV